MLSPAPSQEHLLSESASNEIRVEVYSPPFNLTQQDPKRSRFNFTVAKIDVSCVNCDSEEKRDWQGWIIGKGITGSLNAFLTRIKHMNKLSQRDTPLMRLLTICDNCCIELDWDGKPDYNHILSVGSINKISASLVIGLSHKEAEVVVSSKAIIMEGVAMNTIKTVGMDSEWKNWFLLNKP
jgi:hypothetical protein